MARVIEFHDFCGQVLKLHLTPGQTVVAKVAFGGYEPCDLQGEERELAIQMFGGVERVPADAKRYIVLRLGRGSGKTTMCSAYSIYEAVTHDISRCGPGDVPYVIIVAPDKETAKLSIRMAREMVRGQPALERLIVSDTDQMIQLRRPDGRMVRIEAFAASRGGSAMRGRTIIAFLMDEAEFFMSNADGGRDYSVNDHDIWRALKPRLLPNGRGMLVSTPWPVETLMGSLFEENWGHPKTAVAVKAPTLLVRGDDPDVAAMVQDELAKDPENARRELFCELDGVSGGEFFDINALQTSLDTVYEYPQAFNPRWPVAVGVDFGFTRDSSAIAVVQYDGEHYRTVFVDEMKPQPGKPLKPSQVVKKFAEIAKRYGSSYVISDGYYREAIKESLAECGLGLVDAPTGASGKAEVFQRTRAVLNEGHCKIPDVTIGRRMIQQAKLVSSKATPGGTVSIRVPRKLGLGHGDIVSAWVLAVHKLAYSQVREERIVHEPGTPEWNAEFMRRQLTHEEKALKEYLRKAEREVRSGMSGVRRRRAFGTL
jgi:hypothetical protein